LQAGEDGVADLALERAQRFFAAAAGCFVADDLGMPAIGCRESLDEGQPLS
jgi:hypothetical protein